MSLLATPAPSRYEPTDASPRVVALTAGVLAAGVASSLLIGLLLCRTHLSHRPAVPSAGLETSFRYGPKEQTSIERAWHEQDAAVRAHLEAYAWVDRTHGIVRIPIDCAMKLMAAGAAESRTARQQDHSGAQETR